MPSTVEQLSPSRVKITIEVPFSDLKPSLDKAYQDVAKQVSIPGFRKGKVPPMVIDQRVGRGTILQEAINSALPEFYGKAIEENTLVPLGQPEIEVTNLVDKEVVEFTAEVDVRPEFDLPDFSAIAAEVEAIEVTEEQVTEQLDALRQRFGSINAVERAAGEGDVVTISLVARKDGEPLEDATAEDVQYTVGAGGMLDGLDEAVTGLSAGESATFTSQLVGGVNKGEDVDVEVSVSQVAERDLPEADDDFAQLASEFDTIDELTEQIREQLARMHRVEQAQAARDAVLEKAIAEIEVELPEKVAADELEARRQQINSQLAQAGLTLEAYLADSEEAESPEAFWADVEKRSRDALLAQLVLDKYAEEIEVPVDQNDLTQHIMRIAQAQGSSPQAVMEHMMEHTHHLGEYMTEIRRGKALAAIVEAATVTDSNGEVVELANLQADGSFADETDADEAVVAESPASPESPESPDSPDSPASPASPASADEKDEA